MPQFTRDQVAQHRSADDCWIIVDGRVFDVTAFLKSHPGGAKVLLRVAGTDATSEFNNLHSESVLHKYAPQLCIGKVLSSSSASSSSSSSAAAAPSKLPPPPPPRPTTNKVAPSPTAMTTTFGSLSSVPFSEPDWYSSAYHSPYYKQTHREFRARMRAFVDTELLPHVGEWDRSGDLPRLELGRKAYAAGGISPFWPAELGGKPPADTDWFHEYILFDELARSGHGGVMWRVWLGNTVGLPPVIHFGSAELRERVARSVITGEKTHALAVSEPYAGSDVAAIRTTAVRDGDVFVVNGEKKFITNGVYADYFTVAVRTGGAGHSGLSMLLIERDTPGFAVRKMDTQGLQLSGTAYLTFENVRVPVSNLIGSEGNGFKQIMHNFNHERFVTAAFSIRFARVCLEDAVRYMRLRKTFGSRLADHQVLRHKVADMARQIQTTRVLRHKVADMARQIQTTQAFLEHLCYQLCHNVPDQVLSGPIAMAKAHATRVFELCARESSQIIGGNCYIRSGVGERIERLYREVRFCAIGGGSEEVLLDYTTKAAKL